MTFPPLEPSVILAGRYQVVRPLGQGGMGTVYLARDQRFGQRFVALKENLNTGSPAAQAQFRLEAEVLSSLRHPHLPAVTDFFLTPEGRQFLVMDYIEGESLEERVARAGPLPEPLALAWAAQVLDALAYMHGQNPPVIHRDVKPANIRLTPAGQAVLVDFGLAKQLVPGWHTATAARMAGSPGYAPIEQYAGGTDQRSDLYSLGATLYFALTGCTPPEAPLRAAGKELPRPRQVNQAITPRVEAAILRAMQIEAGHRFQNAEEMRAALSGGKATGDRMTCQQRIILAVGAALVVMNLCALAALALKTTISMNRPTPTLQPTVPPAALTMVESPATTTLVPTPIPTLPPPSATVTPRPTSTAVPTSTPTSTPTRRPPTHTPPPPTDTPLPPPSPPPPPPPTPTPTPTPRPTNPSPPPPRP